jgi:uncharacterized protein
MNGEARVDKGYAAAMAQTSGAIADWLVKNRLLIIIVFGIATAFLGYRATLLKMDPGFNKSIPLAHPYMQTYSKYKDDFGGANTVLVALMQKEGDIFNADFLTTLDDVSREVIYTTGVDRAWVKSLFTPNVFFTGVNEEGFYGARIVPSNFDPTAQGIEQVRANLLQSKEVGRLVSHDMRGALVSALLVEKDPNTGQTLDYVQVAEQLEEIRTTYETENLSVHIVGFAKFITDVIAGAKDVIFFFVITLFFTALMLYFFTGSWQLTLLAVIAALMAVVWQLGLVELLGYGIDPLSILVPFLILAIGISHAVQMTNTWKREYLAGADSVAASREAFNKLFIPGATALLSDAVGFAVIMLIDIEIIHELGITASIGVAVMIITNKFLLPALLCYASLSANNINRARTQTESRVWRSISKVANRGIGVFVAVTLMVGVGYWKGKDLIIGDSQAGAPELYPDSAYNQDLGVIIDNFNVAIDELIVIAETVDLGCVQFDVINMIDRFDWEIANVEGVQAVQTLAKVVKERMVGNSEGNWKFYNVPRNRYSIGNTVSDRSMNINQQHFKYDCTAVPLRIYTEDHRAPTLKNAINAVEKFAAKNNTDRISLHLASGNAGIMAATNEAVENAEVQMNLTLFAAVGLFCFLTFFSWRAAICIVLPLALVAYFGNAVMAILGIGLKVSTLPVVALGVGIGVDYGIYLFARTYTYIRQGIDLQEAYYRALTEVGTAVVFTAATMTIGVATWAFSTLKFQADMGVLLAYMFFVNMLGAIFIMPALAAWLFPEALREAPK